MDLVVKAKAHELAALNFLNGEAPEVYQGKNKGFFWAVHEANKNKENIDFYEVAQIKLEKYFDGVEYESKADTITHLTADEEEFAELSDYLTKLFDLKRPIQRAYCVRTILKWGVMRYMVESEDEEIFQEGVNNLFRFYVAVNVSDMLLKNSDEDFVYINEIIEIMNKRKKRKEK